MRRASYAQDLAAASRRSASIGRARVGVFVLVGIAILLFESASPTLRLALVGGSAILGLIFLVLVVVHGRARKRERWLETRIQLCDEGLRRIGRHWQDLPELGDGPAVSHPYAADLDLFGPASLSRLIGSVATTPGRTGLRRLVLFPPPVESVPERQLAVRELAGHVELRETLGAWGRIVGSPTPESLEGLLGWAESDTSMLPRWARVASWTLPPLTLGLGIASLAGWITASFWLLPAALAVVSSARLSRRLHGTFGQISSGEVGVADYARLFEPIERDRFDSSLLEGARARLSAGGVTASVQLARLLRWVDMADAWRNPMFHWPLQALTLWDFHVARSLEKWRSTSGRLVRDWIDVLGEVDGLAALGTLWSENPDWSFPTLVEGGDRLVGKDLVHPYLADGEGVRNDVQVGPPGTFLLVTGSNMSGKSTLLRAIGVNVVLARIGAPVAATTLRLPPVQLETSMRVQDSLEAGVSFFMAELQSLKEVVDAARAPGGELVLYLLDEILQGTNTAERQIAARTVVRSLLDAGAIGAITTHDLHLADVPDLAERSDPVHFSETFIEASDGPRLSFDYTLRPGLATSTNALTLMKLVGLDEGVDS